MEEELPTSDMTILASELNEGRILNPTAVEPASSSALPPVWLELDYVDCKKVVLPQVTEILPWKHILQILQHFYYPLFCHGHHKKHIIAL